MATVDGFFIPPGSSRAFAYVRGTVGTVREWELLDVTFKIDTASAYTVLLDDDFVAGLVALGCPAELVGPQWINSRPDIIREVRPGETIAGKTGPIYRIVDSWLRLCHPDGVCPRKNKFLGPVYGTFSGAFRRGDGPPDAPAHRSLLGCRTLHQIREFTWNSQRQTVRLTGV